MVFSTVTKVQYFAKKVVGTPVFGIILREIYTMILVLIISRRSYDHLYHESHRYHIGGISTTRYWYRYRTVNKKYFQCTGTWLSVYTYVGMNTLKVFDVRLFLFLLQHFNYLKLKYPYFLIYLDSCEFTL